jgi:hypothetical protein
MVQILHFTKKIDGGLIIAALLSLFAIEALLQPGLPTSADLAIHLHRTMEFERAWAPGVIVPRWAPNLAYGYGYPLFVFAPPLPYVLGMELHLVGFNLDSAFKLLIMFTILLYPTGMYLFGRDLFASPGAGLIAATAYAFAPFALRESLLAGGNIPQLLAIGLFPWPLWAISRAVGHQSWGWTVLAGIFYAAIILSHLFHALVFSAILGLFIGLLLITGSPTRPANFSFIRPLLAPIIGLLLSAFFWLPAFVERYDTRAQAGIYLEKSPFFVRYPYWPELVAWIQPLDTRAANPYTPLTLGLITLILAALGLLIAIFKGWRVHISNRKIQSLPSNDLKGPTSKIQNPLAAILFFAAIAAIATCLALPLSQPVWEYFTILQVAEFPWRMIGPANLGLAVVAGAAGLGAPPKVRRPLAAIFIGLQLWAVGPYLYPAIPFTQYSQLTVADQINYERSSQSIGTTTLGEYLPQTVTRPPTTSPLVETFQTGSIPERLDRSSIPPRTTATLLEQTAVTHRYQVNGPGAFTLRLFQFNFPGWQAQIDGQSVTITGEDETGLILIDIPAGPHTLTVHFGETPVRVAAMILTGLTIGGLMLIAVARYRRRPAVINMSDPEGFEEPGGEAQPWSPKQLREPAGLNLNSPGTLAGIIVIWVTALWLKPLGQPLFSLDSPRERILPAQYQANIRFANGIQLAGYDLNQQRVQAGGYLPVVLYWQTGAAPHRVNLQPFVHLDRLDDFTTVAGATNYTPGDVTTETNLPTFHWDNFRYVRDEHDLVIPPATLPRAYAVRIGLIDPDRGGQLIPLADGSGDTARIDTINVLPADSRPVRLAQSLDVEFANNDDAIRLTGFEITALTPARLEFKLAWQSERKPENNYTVFAQLLDSDHNLVTSFDRPPLDGAYPTSTWLSNQSILDPRSLPLEGVGQGQYTLIAGLYNSLSGRRLTTSGGFDYVELSTITIQ